jgi:hypothetical protein
MASQLKNSMAMQKDVPPVLLLESNWLCGLHCKRMVLVCVPPTR